MVFAGATELCLAGQHARQKYKHLMGQAEDPGPAPPLKGLAGRVCRGNPLVGTAFDTLHPDGLKIKPFAWVLGEDGLAMLLGGADSLWDRLRKLGFTDEWIRKKLDDGEQFRLALFPAERAEPASWEGVLRLLDSGFFPAEVGAKCRAHAEALRSTPFAELQARASAGYLRGSTYFAVNESAVGGKSDDERYMSVERFLGSVGTLEETRGFLYCVLGLSDLFDGAGWTKAPDGTHVVREYLMPNQPVDRFPAFVWVELPLREALSLVR